MTTKLVSYILLFANKISFLQEMLPLILSNNKTRLRKDQNLCFVNATLQVLYSIEDVREIFTADDPSAFPPSWPLSKELSRIFHSAGTEEISASELRRYFTSVLYSRICMLITYFDKLPNKYTQGCVGHFL